jgi:hypothetical protein
MGAVFMGFRLLLQGESGGGSGGGSGQFGGLARTGAPRIDSGIVPRGLRMMLALSCGV